MNEAYTCCTLIDHSNDRSIAPKEAAFDNVQEKAFKSRDGMAQFVCHDGKK